MARKVKKKFTGDYREKSIVSHRFLEAYNKLKQKGVFHNYEDFTEKYGYDGDVMTNVAAGKQEAPLMLLWALVNEYGVDGNFLFDAQIELTREK